AEIKKMEYTYEEIEEGCWNMIRSCAKDRKDCQKLTVRLEEFQKSIQSKAERSKLPTSFHEDYKSDSEGEDDNDDGSNNNNENDNDNANQIQRQHVHLCPNTLTDDFFNDVFAAIDDPINDPFESDKYRISVEASLPSMPKGKRVESDNGTKKNDGNNFDDILRESLFLSYLFFFFFFAEYIFKQGIRSKKLNRSSTGILEEKSESAMKAHMNPNAKFEITKDDFVDDMELDLFFHIEDLLNDYNHHFFPWTAFLLVWVVRRDNMKHIGGLHEQQSSINAILEFIYLFSKGCFQHLSFAHSAKFHSNVFCLVFFLLKGISKKNKMYEHLLAEAYHIADGQSRSKLCLSACRALADARVEYLDKVAVAEFLESQAWLSQLPANPRQTSANFLMKCLQVELRKHYFMLSDINAKCLFSDRLYTKAELINEERYVKDPIKRQDDDIAQGRCTWGPRTDNRFDENMFHLVCAHRHVQPLTKAAELLLVNDFDTVYLMFCQALANKLEQPLVSCLSKLFNDQLPIVQVVPAKNFELGLICMHFSYFGYLSVEIAFDNVRDLIVGFVKIGKNFKICRISNQLCGQPFFRNNASYLLVYVLVEHPGNKHVKLICELKLTLKPIFELNQQLRLLIQKFSTFLGNKQVNDIQNEVFKKLKETKPECIRVKSYPYLSNKHKLSSK
ncbi:hypothetical protein RFI_38499, partial [Reticulomyxa filosa]